MSRWTETFQNHPFRTSWNSLSALVADDDLERRNNELAAKEIARIRKVMRYIDGVMEQVDPRV